MSHRSGFDRPAGELRAFLFSDLVGSTAKWEADPLAMSAALAHHDHITRSAVAAAGGEVFKHVGDGVCAVFGSAADAARAALAVQLAVRDEPLLSLRMGIHLGLAEPRDGDWFGPTLNRCARLMGAAHGRQVLLSGAAAAVVVADAPAGIDVVRLGTVHLRGLAVPEEAHQLVADGLVRTHPPLAGQVVDTLPRPRTSFVGRGREVEQALAALGASRVVTLVGVGGTGKTRLAVEVAGRAAAGFADGVLFASLAEAGDEEALVAAIVAAGQLGGGVAPAGDSRVAVIRALADRRALLVLDNCEHLLDPVAATVDELVEHAAELRIVATSREPLGIIGEQVLRVPSLDDAAAVDLLVDRARSHDAGFELAEDARPAAVALCRRLDGLPLAIELAAGRLHALSLTDVAARIDDRFRLLAGRGRTHDRHATLRAALDWSFELLGADEQVLLARLSTFAGRFDVDAVEQVCAAPPLVPAHVVDLVVALVDRSLVVATDDAAAGTHRLLETVRAYAADHLARRGEVDDVADRHARWVRGQAVEYWRAAAGVTVGARSEAFPGGLDNARVAHDHAADRGWGDAACWIASALVGSWFLGGRRGVGALMGSAWTAAEGRRRCEQALALPARDPTARLLCLVFAAQAARWVGDGAAAWRHAVDALDLSNTADTLVPPLLVWGAVTAAAIGVDTGDGPSVEECLAARRHLAVEPADVALCAFEEGRQRAHEGRMADALACFEAASPLAAELEPWRQLLAAVARSHLGAPVALPASLLEVADETGDVLLLAGVRSLLALEVLRRGGAVVDAVVEIADGARDGGLLLGALADPLASLALEAGDPRSAALLLGTRTGQRLALVPDLEARTRAAVGEDDFERLVAEGAGLDEAAIAAVAVAAVR